jgi:hypothetical protein
MTSRTYATLDANRLGDGLLLDMGNLVVLTNADNLDNHRKVLGTVAKGAGDSFFECYFYTDTQPDDLADMCSVGVATADSPLDAYVGEDSDSYGFIVGTGEIMNAGSAVETVNEQAERTCIGVLLRADPVSPSLAFYVDGSFVYELALPTGKFWLPAITVSGLEAGNVRAFVNFGQRGFDYPVAVVS